MTRHPLRTLALGAAVVLVVTLGGVTAGCDSQSAEDPDTTVTSPASGEPTTSGSASTATSEPAGDAVAPVLVEGLTVSATGDLSWSSPPDADHFVVVGGTEGADSWWVWEGDATTVRYGTETAGPFTPEIATEPLAAGTYRWNVLAYGAEDQLVAASAPAVFRCDGAACEVVDRPLGS